MYSSSYSKLLLSFFFFFLLISSRETALFLVTMGVAVLNPQDCLKHPLSHMKHPRNPTACPNRQKKTISNRTRRSPPRKQSSPSPPRPDNNNKNVVVSQVRILKHGEEVPKKTSDLVVEKTDLLSTHRIGPDPEMIPSKIRLPVRKPKTVPFYAGPVTMTSPPPSDVPLPAFFAAKKSVSLFQATDATNEIIRMLRLDIA
ncbi:unnamed protein product [Eruca vesicaria subsp. sativa]|uniref:Uncharacterized protein n=1 Tax=Eruca vesicaria subsp. sativa TaxID=29727 RepID=A0ABC8KRU6_ERUVS|nr:unnamed protein product [Eruca vesicaria subsp. sativa]